MSSKNKIIVGTISAGVSIFLALPLIFPSQTEVKKLLKGEGGVLNVEMEEDDSLPLINSNNPFSKYVNSFKDFYGFGKTKSNNYQKSNENLYVKGDNISSSNVVRSINTDSDPENIFNENVSVENPKQNNQVQRVNLENGSSITKDGHIIYPSAEGYTFNGKFYKNGTYPKDISAKSIEGALSRFHKASASKANKQPAYFMDDNGNMIVKYVADLPELLASAKKSEGFTALEESNRYSGARISNSNNKLRNGDDLISKDVYQTYDRVNQEGKNLELDFIDELGNKVSSSAEASRSGSVENPVLPTYKEEETPGLPKGIICRNECNNLKPEQIYDIPKLDENNKPKLDENNNPIGSVQNFLQNFVDNAGVDSDLKNKIKGSGIFDIEINENQRDDNNYGSIEGKSIDEIPYSQETRNFKDFHDIAVEEYKKKLSDMVNYAVEKTKNLEDKMIYMTSSDLNGGNIMFIKQLNEDLKSKGIKIKIEEPKKSRDPIESFVTPELQSTIRRIYKEDSEQIIQVMKDKYKEALTPYQEDEEKGYYYVPYDEKDPKALPPTVYILADDKDDDSYLIYTGKRSQLFGAFPKGLNKSKMDDKKLILIKNKENTEAVVNSRDVSVVSKKELDSYNKPYVKTYLLPSVNEDITIGGIYRPKKDANYIIMYNTLSNMQSNEYSNAKQNMVYTNIASTEIVKKRIEIENAEQQAQNKKK